MALQAFSFRRAAGAVARIRSVAPSVPAGAPGWATLIVRPGRHPLTNAAAEGRSTVRQGLFSLRTPHRGTRPAGRASAVDAVAYDRWYETPYGRWVGQREVALLLEELAPRPGETVLDVGCGTGFFTRALAAATDAPATGVDLDTAWLAYARRRSAATVSYEVADARRLPYGPASFDLVVSIAALCFIEEERAAVGEMLRVARRRVAIGLLNRHSLLWLQKGRRGGRDGYRGARWHTVREGADLLAGWHAGPARVRTALHLPGGGPFTRTMERLWPRWLHTGAFILLVADVPDAAPA